LTSGENDITIQITYKNVEKTFSGRVNDVWISINKFFSEFIPTFNISSKIILTVDLQNLIKDCANIIAFTEESSHLLISRNKLTDNETLTLQLLANYIGHRLGVMESDTASKEELHARLGKSSKITSTRLGELVKRDVATKTADGKYKITTFGIIQIQREVFPRIKAKIDI